MGWARSNTLASHNSTKTRASSSFAALFISIAGSTTSLTTMSIGAEGAEDTVVLSELMTKSASSSLGAEAETAVTKSASSRLDTEAETPPDKYDRQCTALSLEQPDRLGDPRT